jgi:hypothetical protein
MQPKQLGPYDQLVQYREQLAADLARVEGQVCSLFTAAACDATNCNSPTHADDHCHRICVAM